MLKKIAMVVCLFCAAQLFSADLQLKDGTVYKNPKILWKDQFGLRIFVKKTESGANVGRFVPFSDLSPASLAAYPFADNKSVDRLSSSLLERRILNQKKFGDLYKELDKDKNYAMTLNTPGGAVQLRVFLSVTDAGPDGVAGWICSDTAESIFYGKIYLQGLLARPNEVWVGDIYTLNDTVMFKEDMYQVFTVNEPERPALRNEAMPHPGRKHFGRSGK